MSEAQTALVMGGASGMGLAVVESLVRDGWHVAIVDKDRVAGQKYAAEFGTQALFFEVDVTKYEEQAEAFAKTWNRWGRLDMVYANAGIADRTDLIEPAPDFEHGAPVKPDTFVVDVCLQGVIYSSYLALHFFRKNASKQGNLIMTSSLAGIYAAPGVSAYCAAKHGVVGLTRSLAYRLQRRRLINPDLVKRVPKEFITPTAMIVRAVEQFLADKTLTGQVVECSGDELFFRDGHPFLNEGSKWVMSGGLKTLLAPGEE